jgi:hypothetical protein
LINLILNKDILQFPLIFDSSRDFFQGWHIEMVAAETQRFKDYIYAIFTIKIMAPVIPMQPISIKIPRRLPPPQSRRCDSRRWKGVRT